MDTLHLTKSQLAEQMLRMGITEVMRICESANPYDRPFADTIHQACVEVVRQTNEACRGKRDVSHK